MNYGVVSELAERAEGIGAHLVGHARAAKVTKFDSTAASLLWTFCWSGPTVGAAPWRSRSSPSRSRRIGRGGTCAGPPFGLVLSCCRKSAPASSRTSQPQRAVLRASTGWMGSGSGATTGTSTWLGQPEDGDGSTSLPRRPGSGRTNGHAERSASNQACRRGSVRPSSAVMTQRVATGGMSRAAVADALRARLGHGSESDFLFVQVGPHFRWRPRRRSHFVRASVASAVVALAVRFAHLRWRPRQDSNLPIDRFRAAP